MVIIVIVPTIEVKRSVNFQIIAKKIMKASINAPLLIPPVSVLCSDMYINFVFSLFCTKIRHNDLIGKLIFVIL